MKSSSAILALSLSLFATAAFAEEVKPLETPVTTNTAPKKISTLDATNYYDQTMIVTGKVVQVSVRPKITFINLDKKHPDSPFVAIIFPGATNQFPDVKSLLGKQVEIKGKIAKHDDKPQIILNSSNQVTVLEVSSNAVPPAFPEVKPDGK
jgi:RecJ-like exonuclease